MKEKQPSSRLEFEDLECQDCDDLKEVAFPDDPSGDISRGVRLRFVFQEAGFHVVRIEKIPQQPRVWIIRMRERVRFFANNQRLTECVKQLLRSTEPHVPKSDMSIHRTGKSILVSFILPSAAIIPKRHARQEERE